MTIKFENSVRITPYIVSDLKKFKEDVNSVLDIHDNIWSPEGADMICVIIREKNDDGTFTVSLAATTPKNVEEFKIESPTIKRLLVEGK